MAGNSIHKRVEYAPEKLPNPRTASEPEHLPPARLLLHLNEFACVPDGTRRPRAFRERFQTKEEADGVLAWVPAEGSGGLSPADAAPAI